MLLPHWNRAGQPARPLSFLPRHSVSPSSSLFPSLAKVLSQGSSLDMLAYAGPALLKLQQHQNSLGFVSICRPAQAALCPPSEGAPHNLFCFSPGRSYPLIWPRTLVFISLVQILPLRPRCTNANRVMLLSISTGKQVHGHKDTEETSSLVSTTPTSKVPHSDYNLAPPAAGRGVSAILQQRAHYTAAPLGWGRSQAAAAAWALRLWSLRWKSWLLTSFHFKFIPSHLGDGYHAGRSRLLKTCF